MHDKRLQITPTEHDKTEWFRLACRCKEAGRLAAWERYGKAAAVQDGHWMTCAEFDALQDGYRRWLIDDTLPS